MGLLGAVDRLAVLKWKRKLCPDLISEAELHSLRRAQHLRVLVLPLTLMGMLIRLLRRETGPPADE